MRSSTSLRQTPESMTAWIFSFGPSERYERAQQASDRTSLSVWKSSRDRMGSDGDTCKADRGANGGLVIHSKILMQRLKGVSF